MNKDSDKYLWIIFISIVAIAFLVALIIVLDSLFKTIAEKYVVKHRDRFIKINPKLFNRLKDEGKIISDSRKLLKKFSAVYGLDRTISCSSSVVFGASSNPVKYLLKYSKLDNSKDTLDTLEFIALFIKQYSLFSFNLEKVSQIIYDDLPKFHRHFIKKEWLPYAVCGIDTSLASIRLPYLRFYYVSPAGRSSREFVVELEESVRPELVSSISKNIGKSGHKKSQRAAMTNDLREAIKKRDNYTCQKCGNSVYKEPNLLLEVDHIIPIAKGGKTEADNLQTLCWRCNRAKGAKRGRKHKK